MGQEGRPSIDGGSPTGVQLMGRPHPNRTYSELLEKRKQDLAKDALYEGQSQQLTRCFLHELEELEDKKQQERDEKAQRMYERSLEKAREKEAARELAKRKRKEEEMQVMFDIQEQEALDRIKREEERQRNEDQFAYMHGRIKWEKMQAEQRASEQEKKHAELAKQVAKKEKEREDKVTQMKEDVVQKVKEKIKTKTDFFLKAGERKKQAEKEAWDKKMESVRAHEERRARVRERKKKQEINGQSLAERYEESHRLLEERHDAASDRAVELRNKLLSKYAVEDGRWEEKQVEVLKDREEKADRSMHRQYTRRVARMQQDEEAHTDLVTRLDAKHGRPWCTSVSTQSGEVSEENLQAHREYVRQRNELERQELRMRCDKRFKDVLDSKGLSENQQDSRAARLQNMLDKHLGDGGVKSVSNSSKPGPPKSARTVREVRKLQCGLCNMDYVPDNLPGTASKSAIRKVRKNWLSMTDDPALSIDGSDPVFEGDRYDKLPLCVFCHQFIRQHSKSEFCQRVRGASSSR